MKIGILTFHRPINYGAFLQSYSLSNRLAKIDGFEVEIINYIAPKEQRKIFINALRALKHNGVRAFMQECKKILVFNNFQKQLKLSKQSFCTNNFDNFFSFVDKQYDALIIGSDAVFNWNQTGFPTAFIPEYKFKRCIVYSYAASVHGLKYKDSNKQCIQRCRESFQQFKIVGVRDCESEQFVRYCYPNANVVHCCDPTVFIDIEKIYHLSGDISNRLYNKYKFLINEDYIVVMLPDNELNYQICNYYKNIYHIVTLFKQAKGADYFFYDLNPFEWVSVLSKAKAVVTSYFHGSLLSMKTGTPVIAVDYSKYDIAYESKMKDLFITRFKLPNLYFTEEVTFEIIKPTLDDILSKGKRFFADTFKLGFDNEESYFDKFIETIKG